MPEISLIVPVYNVEPYLKRCLDSICNQTFRDFEVILVYDKSNDLSADICQNYVDRDNRFRLIRNHKNQGLGIARNVGIEDALGKFIVFIDSDDYVEANMLENLYSLAVHTNADTVIAGYKRVHCRKQYIESNKFAGKIYEDREIIAQVLEKMFGRYYNDNIEMSVWKTLFSADIVRKNGIRFPDRRFLSEDIIFDVQYYSQARKVAMSDDVSYCYCYNGNSLSQGYRENKFELIKFQAQEMRKELKNIPVSNMASLRIDNYLVGNTIHHIKIIVQNKKNIGIKNCIVLIKDICSDEVFKYVKWKGITASFKEYEKILIWLLKKKKPYLLYKIISIIAFFRGIKS